MNENGLDEDDGERTPEEELRALLAEVLPRSPAEWRVECGVSLRTAWAIEGPGGKRLVHLDMEKNTAQDHTEGGVEAALEYIESACRMVPALLEELDRLRAEKAARKPTVGARTATGQVTVAEATAAKYKLRDMLGQPPWLAGVGLTWLDGGSYAVLVNVAIWQELPTVPREVDGVEVVLRYVGAVTARSSGEAKNTNKEVGR